MMMRERHFELAKFAVDDPSLAFPLLDGKSEAETRRWAVRNLWVAHWAMLWEMGDLNRQTLRRLFDGIFREAGAIEWWGDYGSTNFGAGRVKSRQRAFIAVADEAYRAATGPDACPDGKSVASPPATDPALATAPELRSEAERDGSAQLLN